VSQQLKPDQLDALPVGLTLQVSEPAPDVRGGSLRLVCTSTAGLRPLRVMGMTVEFSIHANLADALAHS
jgi:hypothetical protein